MFAPRQHQRVNHALGRNDRLGDALQLGIQERDVKAGVVRHERRIAESGCLPIG